MAASAGSTAQNNTRARSRDATPAQKPRSPHIQDVPPGKDSASADQLNGAASESAIVEPGETVFFGAAIPGLNVEIETACRVDDKSVREPGDESFEECRAVPMLARSRNRLVEPFRFNGFCYNRHQTAQRIVLRK